MELFQWRGANRIGDENDAGERLRGLTRKWKWGKLSLVREPCREKCWIRVWLRVDGRIWKKKRIIYG